MSSSRNLANSKMNASGEIVKVGELNEKKRILKEVVPEKYRKAHQSRLYHIHDLEFYDKTYNCIGLTVSDLLNGQKYSVRNSLRKLVREITELTNIQSGGIGFLNFDTDMASYVSEETEAELIEEFRELFLDLNVNNRKGCEKAYVTFNFGLDTSDAGRLVSFALLKAYEGGDENGNPFVFPNLVFKIKNGVNSKTNSINYDLYIKSIDVTAKRMIPTYFNCDSTINRSADSSKIGIMGCRTRVVDNIYGEKSGLNRGNVASVTINLVQLAFFSNRNVNSFISLIRETMINAKESLLHRYSCLLENGNFEQIINKGLYMDYKYKDSSLLLRNGTLSIGFIGLWDALSIIHSIEWNEVEDMQEYLEEAYKIIDIMRKMTDSFAEDTKLNFSLLASAAEGVSGEFASYDSFHAGKNINISKKGYYSNSFHIPVNVKAKIIEKICFEGRFHKLCNGGAITYVELDEMPIGNVKAIEKIINYACLQDCNYFGVNFPLDNCNNCGYIGKIGNCCPRCGSQKIRRLRRVSGYLAETDFFVKGKKLELLERVNHISD